MCLIEIVVAQQSTVKKMLMCKNTNGNLQDRVAGTPLVGGNHTSCTGGFICREEECIWKT